MNPKFGYFIQNRETAKVWHNLYLTLSKENRKAGNTDAQIYFQNEAANIRNSIKYMRGGHGINNDNSDFTENQENNTQGKLEQEINLQAERNNPEISWNEFMGNYT